MSSTPEAPELPLITKPFRIIYGRGRFPIRQKRPDGTYGCRGCGGKIGKGRRTWCSSECANRYDPGLVLIAVRARDKGICALCGFDHHKAVKEWRSTEPKKPRYEDRNIYLPEQDRILLTEYYRNHNLWLSSRPKNLRPEYDHIVPFSEGGLTVLENMRTLCYSCHKKLTAEWRRKKANKNGSS